MLLWGGDQNITKDYKGGGGQNLKKKKITVVFGLNSPPPPLIKNVCS